MAIELTADSIVCSRCGTRYAKRRTNFHPCYGAFYRGVGYLHICKNCLEVIYNTYLAQSKKSKDAVRQTCRKLDLYWNEDLYESIASKNAPKAIMDQYISRLNQKYAGKSYDDTLIEEDTLWQFGKFEVPEPAIDPVPITQPTPAIEEEVDPELVDFWGVGFSSIVYDQLQKRYNEWLENVGTDKFDTATEMLVKQICLTERDIAVDRENGASPEKSIQILNSLLGSANLKPAQQKQEEDSSGVDGTPLGVWLLRFENERPLPEIDDDLKDVNQIRKYVFTWMGHLCKMLGIKNAYADLYEDAISRYSVQKPEYEDDEESLAVSSLFGEDD